MENIKKTAIKNTAKDVLYFFCLLGIILGALGIFYLAQMTLCGSVIFVVAVVLFSLYVCYLDNLEKARVEEKSKQYAIEQAEKIKSYVKDGGHVRVGRNRAYVKDTKGLRYVFDYNGKYYELVKSIVYGD